jgi:protein-tyrosine phosphatase
MAVHVLRARLGDTDWLSIESAGTAAQTGATMTDQALALAREYGADELESGDHRARQVTGSLIDASDLILTMTRHQRRDVVGLAPRKLRKTFTVVEFSSLIEGIDDDALQAIAAEHTVQARWDRLIQTIMDTRYLTEPAWDEDVLDPIGKDEKAYRRCAQQLMPAVSVIEEALRVVGAGSAPASDRGAASPP